MAKQKPQEIINEVQRYVNQDPTISDPSKISVTAYKRGGLLNKRTVLALEGKAQNELEIKAIGDMVAAKVGDEVDVENRLSVSGS
ncbi:MAG: hypothetical protein ACLFPO_07740 [Spirochaetaceae bacterium]